MIEARDHMTYHCIIHQEILCLKTIENYNLILKAIIKLCCTALFVQFWYLFECSVSHVTEQKEPSTTHPILNYSRIEKLIEDFGSPF